MGKGLYCGFHEKARQTEILGLGLAGLNNFSRFWTYEVISVDE